MKTSLLPGSLQIDDWLAEEFRRQAGARGTRPMCVADGKGFIVDANAAWRELFGPSPPAGLAHQITDLVHDDERVLFERMASLALNGRICTLASSFRILAVDGEWRPVTISVLGSGHGDRVCVTIRQPDTVAPQPPASAPAPKQSWLTRARRFARAVIRERRITSRRSKSSRPHC